MLVARMRAGLSLRSSDTPGEAHGMALSPEEALLLAFRAELDKATTPRGKSVREAVDGPSEDGSSEKEEEK
jgi:hypothetical protein